MAPLERAWRDHQTISSVRLIQGAIAMVMVFYAGFFLYLTGRVGINLDPVLFNIFLLFGSPGNLATIVVTLVPRWWRWLRVVAIVGVLIHTYGTYLYFQRARELGIEFPTELLTLQIIFVLFFLGLAFREAVLLVAVAMLIAPLAAETATPTQEGALTSLFFVGATAVLGSLGCYMSERSQRVGWLRQIMLRVLADRDSLTNLLNHGAFLARAERVLRQARRTHVLASVVIADVDHFKQYNDTFGHAEGDECLRRVSATIDRFARRPLDLAGRLGGEEFALLLFDVTPDFAWSRCEELRRAIMEHHKPDRTPVTASFGLAHFEIDDPSSIHDVLRMADEALYMAKSHGRNRVQVRAHRADAPQGA